MFELLPKKGLRSLGNGWNLLQKGERKTSRCLKEDVLIFMLLVILEGKWEVQQGLCWLCSPLEDEWGGSGVCRPSRCPWAWWLEAASEDDAGYGGASVIGL